MSEPTPPVASSILEDYRPMPVPEWRAPRQRYWLHALLLLATCFTTLVVGARMQYNFAHSQPVFSLDDSAAIVPGKLDVFASGAAAAGSAIRRHADADFAGARDGALSLLRALRSVGDAAVFYSCANANWDFRRVHSDPVADSVAHGVV
jgi:uncharacterized membrane protein YhaH (DUF805 family)